MDEFKDDYEGKLLWDLMPEVADRLPEIKRRIIAVLRLGDRLDAAARACPALFGEADASSIPTAAPAPALPKGISPGPKRTKRIKNDVSVKGRVVQVMAVLNRPARIKEIADGMVSADWKSNSKTLSNAVNKNLQQLRKDDVVQSLGDGTYELTARRRGM